MIIRGDDAVFHLEALPWDSFLRFPDRFATGSMTESTLAPAWLSIGAVSLSIDTVCMLPGTCHILEDPSVLSG